LTTTSLKSPRQLPSALDCLNDILPDDKQQPALFLDYDGTLTPIVASPDEAVLSVAMRVLASWCPGSRGQRSPAIVSTILRRCKRFSTGLPISSSGSGSLDERASICGIRSRPQQEASILSHSDMRFLV
jgi:hypothetical protein